MIEAKKKKEKASVSEEDFLPILQRYTATTILALLQEVAQFASDKIDWNALVGKTSTGISNAREYQMLWRHLAYRDALLEKVEDGIEPLDDDSDLEIELEPSPAVNAEASAEAAACVKVLIASGSPSDSGPLNRATVEAPLTINIPNGQSSRNPSDNPQLARSTQGTNITIPVSVQKQPLPSVPSSEGFDGNGSVSGNLMRRKRKLWTTEEDRELIAAVQKCGEGNWANILKGDFKHERTASQLSQRWAIIRKRKATSTTSSAPAGTSTGVALTEAQLAARQAVSMALNMPMKGSLSATCLVAGIHHSSIPSNSSTVPATTADAAPVSAPPPEASSKDPVLSSQQTINQSQQAPNQAALSRVASTSNMGPPKSRANFKRHSVPAKSSPLGPNPIIQAAAVAAGARIANPSTAASLFKAAQSRNAVHIRQGGSVPKSSMPGVSNPLGTNTMGPLPSNVHFIRTGLASHPPAYSGMVLSGQRPSSQQVQGGSGRLAVMGQHPPTGSTTSSNLPVQQVIPDSKSAPPTCGNADSKKSPSVSNVDAGFGPSVSSASEFNLTKEKKLDSTAEVPKEPIQYQASLPNTKAGGNQGVVDGAGENRTLVVRKTNAADTSPGEYSIGVDEPMDPTNKEAGENQSNKKTGEKNKNVIETTTGLPNTGASENQVVISEASEYQNPIDKQEVLPNAEAEDNLTTVNGGCENENVLEKQTGLPDNSVGGNQTVDGTIAVEEPNAGSG